MYRNNKHKYGLIILLLFVCVSMGYAYLNSTLIINGKSNISKNTWDIHFDNLVLKEGSVTDNLPELSLNNITVDTKLNLPGDYYGFSVDIVNDGTLDAKIEKIEFDDLNSVIPSIVNFGIYFENEEIEEKTYFLIAGEKKTLTFYIEYNKGISDYDLPTEDIEINFTYKVIFSQGDKNPAAYFKVFGRQWLQPSGVSIYDAINNRYEEYEAKNYFDNIAYGYPYATEYFVNDDYATDSYVIVGEDGKVLNLKNTIVESGKLYQPTDYRLGAKIITDVDRFKNGDYITTFVDTSTYSDLGMGVIPVFVDDNDAYVNVAHTLQGLPGHPADVTLVEKAEQDIIAEYILGFPSGQNVGCGVETSHKFYAFLTSEGALVKMSDKVKNLDRTVVYTVYISEEEATYEEAKQMVIGLLSQTVNHRFGTKINEERFMTGDYITTYIDTSYTDMNQGIFNVFVDQNDTYINVAHTLYYDSDGYLNPYLVEAAEQEVLADYILAFPSGQTFGSTTENNHSFIAFLDEDDIPKKITDKVNDRDKFYISFFTISASEATYEEAKGYVLEMLNSALNGSL